MKERVKRKRVEVTWLLSFLLPFAFCLLPFAAAPAAAPGRVVKGEGWQEFVFLGESRPVLIRLNARVDGKSVHAAWSDFMRDLFAYLDVNGDGVLSKEEAERAPSIEQFLSAGLGANGRGGGLDKPTPAALDLDRDGKVTLAELASWYRADGFAPFSVRMTPSGAGALAMSPFGGPPEPGPQEVADAIFKLLDRNGDGRLSKEELAAAPAVLLRLDEDQDEIITTRELVPNPKRSGNLFGAAMRMGGKRPSGANVRKILIPLPTPGQAPPDLASAMLQRYGKKSARTLSRVDLGLDESTFRRLDADGDGKLDAKELAAFVTRPADLELTVRLGDREEKEEAIQVAPGGTLGAKARKMGELALLDLGATRLDLKAGEKEENDYSSFTDLIRQQMLAQFRQADKDNNGYLDAKEAAANQVYRNVFKAMDRDGDGKLYEKEVLAYLKEYQKIQAKATASCVSLVLAGESRGLFDLLDVNRDKKLSVRELRGAVGLLKQLDHKGRGYLTRADLPRTYALTVGPGPGQESLGQAAAFAAIYRVSDSTRGEGRGGAGPVWFRKMDRNRDGDVSRKEWLFSQELFDKIDTDGDGLISVEEAERYDAQRRKQE
jgi:Ca2+-binding EF-hand superfamily protein